ncbi:transcriptional regulator [Actinotalea ferrariae CF5-4]|uniref:Transcriptional regulator n=1 Tax=Actinotalea ferrariae CF5-4 TaxID=948458 RepID=A0A021VVI4_9CELL|nr:LCP family protein [Actinotalea ferrariae]EYR65128.1 transcriptional regulator [Actinotalea ferrariae CF5-4]
MSHSSGAAHDDGPGGENPEDRRLRDRRGFKVTLIALASVVVIGVVGVAVLLGSLDRNVERLGDPFAALPTRPAPLTPTPQSASGDGNQAPNQEPLTMLVLGSDSRISAGDPSQWERGAQRTDVMMLVHLPADGQSGYVMSLPRDSWVDIPGYGEAKLNAAFSYGGPTLLIQTVEQLTGLPIDHFTVTDFESFKRITDVLGGVTMNLTQPMKDANGDVVLPEGTHLLDGEEALQYVRERYNLPRGDVDRVQRQQAWIRALVRRTQDGGVLNDPSSWYPLLDAVTESIAVDEGLTRQRMVDLLTRVRSIGDANLRFFTVPLEGLGTSADGQSIVLLDRPRFDALMQSVRDGTVAQYLEQNPDAVDTLPAVTP